MARGVPLAILGAGSLGRECAWLVERINESHGEPKWDLRGFFDRSVAPGTSVWRGVRCVGTIESLSSDHAVTHLVCAIGDPEARFAACTRAAELRRGLVWPELVDPTAIIGPGARLGEGCLVFAQSVVSIETTLGRGTILDKQAAIGHDTRIGDFCMLYPGARIAGNCNLGDRVSIGAGANVIEKLRIGSGSFVGAGAAVIRDVPPDSVAVGVPARLVMRTKPRDSLSAQPR